MPTHSWTAPRRASRLACYAASAAFALGVALRVLAFLQREAFWSDEAALGLNILACDFAKLGRPFLHAQVAPYLFMAGQKLISLTVGGGEPQLRAWSLLAGIALLPALHHVTLRVADRSTALVVLALAATTPLLVYYSTELKPYGSDALVSTLLLWSTLRVLSTRERPLAGRAFWQLAAAGAVAPWLSLPAVFVLAGCGIALCAQLLAERARLRDLSIVAAVGCGWLLSFVVHYLYFLHQSPDDASYMQRYWADEDGFAPHAELSGAAVASLHWYAAKFCYLFAALVLAVGHGQRYIAAGLWLLGLWQVWRTQRAQLWLFVVPVFGMFAAATLHAYAIADRLALFLLPVLLIPCGIGVSRLVRWRTPSAPAGLLAVLALVSVEHLHEVYSQLTQPRSHSDIRSLVAYLRERVAPEDRVLVETRVAWVYEYYAYRYGIHERPLVVDAAGSEPSLLQDSLLPPTGTGRVWAVVPALGPRSRTELGAAAHATVALAERRVVDALAHLGPQLEVYDGSNVRLYLYDPVRARQANAP